MINPAMYLLAVVVILVVCCSLMDEIKSIGENIEKAIRKILEEKK